MPDIEEIRIDTGGMWFSGLAAGPADGRLVLLLHGWPQGAGEWEAQIETLAGAGYRAVAFDQRGYSDGARPTEVDQYASQHLAADVLAVADQLGGHAVDLVGHDWGAVVAWNVATAYPERVRTLTTVSVPHPMALIGRMGGRQGEMSEYMTFFQQPEVPERLLLADDALVLRAMFTGTDDPEVLDRMRALGFKPEPGLTTLGPEVGDRWARAMARPGVLTAALAWYRSMGSGTLFAGDITVPTMFVWSDGDFVLGREAADDTAGFVSGPYRFEVLEGVSHWVPEEAPDALSGLILDHLANHG